MTTALERLLRECVVLLKDKDGTSVGTGFLVDHGLLLTAAHVARRAAGICYGHADRSIGPTEVVWAQPGNGDAGGGYPLPDIALLRVEAPSGHPCVLLGDADPADDLLAVGYTRGLDGGSTLDSLRPRFQSVRPEQRCAVIRFNTNRPDNGLSGAPLVDVKTGRVVGVIKAQHDEIARQEGVAVAMSYIRDEFPNLWAANLRFHQSDRRWSFACMAGESPETPAEATRKTLKLIHAIVEHRPVIAPPGSGIADLQIPSVRRQHVDTGPGTSMPSGQAPGTVSAPADDGWAGVSLDEDDGLFRWRPLRMSEPAVVLSGTPGQGKSCLLALHANAIVTDSLRQLDESDSAALSVQIPILMDCAVLGRRLPQDVNRDAVAAALVAALRFGAEPHLTEGVSDDSLRAVIRQAYDDGRLISCLDALDEVNGEARARVLHAMRHLVDSRTTRSNRLIVTSRPGEGPQSAVKQLRSKCFTGQVVGFSPGQVFAFAARWFADNPNRETLFADALRDRSELRALARVPLLSAFMCQLVSEGDDIGALPTSAVALYGEVVRAALSGNWRHEALRALPDDIGPDPRLRLRLLAHSVGKLTREWRSRVDRFSVSDLETVLNEHPDYRRVATAARARFAAWQASQPLEGRTTEPSCAVRWEYMFDGILVFDSKDHGETLLRFAHPVLGEFCIATYLASLPKDQLAVVVANHRWFDASWEQIWSLTAALMEDPGQLVACFLDDHPDGWHEQTFLAARCVTGARGRVSAEVTGKVIAEVCRIVLERRPFDLDRALKHLLDAVHARVPAAVTRARSLLADESCGGRARVRVAAMLAQIGDEGGITVARALLPDPAMPVAYRSWLAHAVVQADDFLGIAALHSAIRNARNTSELRQLVSAIPMETTQGGDVLLDVLRDESAPIAIRVVAARALIRTGDAGRIQMLKDIAANRIATAYPVRAALMAELLAAGEDDVAAEGIVVLTDPNVTDATAVALLENMIRQGGTAVLAYADRYLQSRSVAWYIRKRLADAIARQGQAGIDQLKKLVSSALDLDLKLRPLIALVEVGEALDDAAGMVQDAGKPTWIRRRLACTLLEKGDPRVNPSVLIDLAADSTLGPDFRSDLIAAMAARGVAGTAAAVLDILKEEAKTFGNSYFGNRELIAALAGAGNGGMDLLEAIAADSDVAQDDRALALMRLAVTAPAQAGRIAMQILPDFDAIARPYLVVRLAEKGVVELASQIAEFASFRADGYEAIYRMLASPRATSDLIVRMIGFGDGPQETASEPPRPLNIDEEFFENNGATFASEVDKRSAAAWIYRTLESRVGEKLAIYMADTYADELESLTTAEESSEFLEYRVPGHQDFVRQQVDILKEEIRAHPELLAAPSQPRSETPPIRVLAYVAQVLSEWLDVGHAKGRFVFLKFMQANKSVIVSDEARELLVVACKLSGKGIRYEGPLYILYHSATFGFDDAVRFIEDSGHRHNVYCDLLAASKGQDLYLAGHAGAFLDYSAADAYFYAALGAVMIDKIDQAHELMRFSHRMASARQRSQGRKTIHAEAIRLNWSSDIVNSLLEDLPSENGSANGEGQVS